MRLRRQIWAAPTPTTSELPSHCTPFKLLAGGLIDIAHETVITLSQNAVFQPACSGLPPPQPIDIDDIGTDTSVIGTQDPFYSSTSPQIYAIAAATIVSYMLVIILFITPRAFHISGSAGENYFVGQSTPRGSSVIGASSRPWLQKVAALTVAISLTIATADTFKVAEKQYYAGYQDATALTDLVVGGMEIRIVRVISDTCLWLAQVQTLIRLFTRHKEKVIIKWIGFGLIVLDTIFSILNHFVVDSKKTRPRRFVNAIPALSYLFTLALSLLYAAWVIYYALSKHRYAFYHRKMRNMFLIAIIAVCAIHVPVVFFVLDIAQPNAAGWGNYVRWVGAAAASVVVWEWVERIEALERDEKKDGILGREIFYGDEMLQVTPSTEVGRPRHPRDNGRKRDSYKRQFGGTSTGWNGMAKLKNRFGVSRRSIKGQRNKVNSWETFKNIAVVPGLQKPASPVNREDTTSATSTVYVVHYHQDQDPTQNSQLAPEPRLEVNFTDSNREISPTQGADLVDHSSRWQRIANQFKSKRSSPPAEIAQACASRREVYSRGLQREPDEISHSVSFLERFRHRKNPQVDLSTLPRTIIPPPRRGIDMLIEEERELERNGIEMPQNQGDFPAAYVNPTTQIAKENMPGNILDPTYPRTPSAKAASSRSNCIPENSGTDNVNVPDNLSMPGTPSTPHETSNASSSCPIGTNPGSSGDLILRAPNPEDS